MQTIFIVGAGLWGCTTARLLAEQGYRVNLIEKRSFIGGNCSSTIDQQTGIGYHRFGTHIFHTSNVAVWHFINRFTQFNHYKHTVYSTVGDKTYSLPVNLATINSFFNKNFNPSQAKAFIEEQAKPFYQQQPSNFEEQALNLMGKELYQAFFQGYTEKQWHKKASQLPATILKRLPFRFNYDNNYFFDLYQGIPINGYQAMFEALVDHPLISITLNCDFNSIKETIKEEPCFYTGAIDELCDYHLGELEYRSLQFELTIAPVQDYQGCSVLNYGDAKVPYTRIAEYKHFHPENKSLFNSEKTLLVTEYPSDYKRGMERYYPVATANNLALYQQYRTILKQEWPTLIIGGRLGEYQYFDMDKTIANAMATVNQFLKERIK